MRDLVRSGAREERAQAAHLWLDLRVLDVQDEWRAVAMIGNQGRTCSCSRSVKGT